MSYIYIFTCSSFYTPFIRYTILNHTNLLIGYITVYLCILTIAYVLTDVSQIMIILHV